MLITEDLIVLNLPAKNKDEAIQMLAEKAAAVGRVADVVEYCDAVHHRESVFLKTMPAIYI